MLARFNSNYNVVSHILAQKNIMKYVIVFLQLLLNFHFVHAQNENKYKKSKHILELETGVFDRGAFGVGYNYNAFLKEKDIFLSTHISAGVGPSLGGVNVFFSFSEELNLGKKIYFTIGPDIKYSIINYLDGGDWFGTNRYNGILFGGHVGLGVFSQKRFNFKLRIGYLQSTEKVDFIVNNEFKEDYRALILPTIGFSFGWRIGK